MPINCDVTGFDLANPPDGFIADPFPYYDALLRDAPVLPQPDGSVVLSRHADLDRVYRDTTLFSSDKRRVFQPKFGAGTPLFEHHTTSLVFNDPPLHTRVRRIMASALTPRAISRMEPGLATAIDGILDDIGDGPVDLIADYAAIIPIQVIGNLLDIPFEDRAPLRDWSLAILGALEPTLSEEALARGHAAVSEFSNYLKGLIARRRANPGDPDVDVLTRLIAGDREGNLSEKELIQNCIFILNAGHETTTNLIGSGLVLLHDWPEAQALLRADPALFSSAVEEVLRFRSPNQFGNRETTAEAEFDGLKIPAGTNLHLCIGAANRDPQVFDDPEKFVITRFRNRHLAFAGGPHTCIGLSLARMEGRIALSRFFQRFQSFEIGSNRVVGARIRFHGYTSVPAILAA
jgi:cytochrome P450